MNDWASIMKLCGIYCIINIVNKKRYIGSSKDIKYRFYYHKYQLYKGIHFNDHLQKSWDKYGEDNFIFHKLSICNEADLLTVEQYYINLFKTYNPNFGYNLEKLLSNRRRQRSKYTKQKISSACNGRKVSQETRKKLIDHPNAFGKHNTRKTHCPYGHPYSGDNLILKNKRSGIERSCKTCRINYTMKKMDAINPNRKRLDQTGDYCCHGHRFDEQNTYYRGSRRCCVACKIKRERKKVSNNG